MFHEAMSKRGTEVYSLKMTKEKRKGKYEVSIGIVQRRNRSDIILFESIRFSHLLGFFKVYVFYLVNCLWNCTGSYSDLRNSCFHVKTQTLLLELCFAECL